MIFRVSEAALQGVLRKKCSWTMQQICGRAHMPKCDFNKVAATVLKSHFDMGALL